MNVAAVLPTESARLRLSPIDARGVRIEHGFWAERLRVNREVTLPHGAAQLERAGNLENFRIAAGGSGSYSGTGGAGVTFPFLDSDVYKWLEAVGWELGREGDPGLAGRADEVIATVGAAQRSDGYLNTWVQVMARGHEFHDLAWGHELYTAGHLIQAGVAWQRAAGDGRLLGIARRAADRIEAELGPGRRAGIDGHPEIEMALVELYRLTHEKHHLELARRLIDERGQGLLGPGRFGAPYWQDHAPVREARTVAGHAVRQLYLDCGAVDLALETGDSDLLGAVVGRWDDMAATRTYLTGGLGARHRDESFGDPFELPPDQAYAETCAGIGSVMLAWRLLLATGEAKYANLIERTLFNAVLPGVSLDGTGFFYVNPLQRRTGHVPSHEPATAGRSPWFACACCPPNLMRLLSSLEHYLATVDDEGVQVHQFAAGSIQLNRGGGDIRLEIATDYPWDGRVGVTVSATPRRRWTLSLRVPDWCRAATLAINGVSRAVAPDEEYVRVARAWEPGDLVELGLEMPARITVPDPRIDSVRGCAAIERGPLVYCLEEADLPAGVQLEDVLLPPEARSGLADGPELPRGIRTIRTAAFVNPAFADSGWPYHDVSEERTRDQRAGSQVTLSAIPYFAWANRKPGAMRVWMPLRETKPSVSGDDGTPADE